MTQPAKSSKVRFQVRRTSTSYDETPPCVEAVKGTIPYWDVRTFKSPEEHDAKLGKPYWADVGTEHQLVYGPRGGVQGIKRRKGDHEAWFVEFDSLAGLMAFYEKYGDLVLTTSWEDKETPMLEIYDDYRE